MTLFKRDISVRVNARISDVIIKQPIVTITGLRTAFKVDKNDRSEPNNMELTIYNLAENTRKRLQSLALNITVEAGYVGSKSILFSGDVRHVSHERKEADWISRIFCGDGETTIREARIDVSRKAGTALIDIVKKFMTEFEAKGTSTKTALAIIIDTIASGKFTDYLTKFTFSGSANSGFSDIMKSLGLKHSIQNNELVVSKIEPTYDVKGRPIFVDLTTGLIGSPAYGEDKVDPKTGVRRTYIKIKTLLNPDVQPHNQVVLASADHKSEIFYVEKVTHTGDTHGQDWYTEVEGQQVK